MKQKKANRSGGKEREADRTNMVLLKQAVSLPERKSKLGMEEEGETS